MKNNLVVYYSWIGNTKVIADEIHKQVGGEIRRIEEVKERQKGAGMGTAAMGAIFGLKSRLKPFDYDFSKYENIFLGAQVWAGRSTQPINTFLSKADFRNKKVYLFIARADDKQPQKVIDSITSRIKRKGGEVIDVFSTITRIDPVIQPEAVSAQITEWVGKLALN